MRNQYGKNLYENNDPLKYLRYLKFHLCLSAFFKRLPSRISKDPEKSDLKQVNHKSTSVWKI